MSEFQFTIGDVQEQVRLINEQITFLEGNRRTWEAMGHLIVAEMVEEQTNGVS